jgi:L-asparagine oxygenase
MDCVVNQADCDYLVSLVANITASPSSDPEQFCQQVKGIVKDLPFRLRRVLKDFAEKGSPTGCLLFRTAGLVDGLGATPADNCAHVGELTVLAHVQAVLMSALGDLVAYEAEGGGRLFQDVVPTRTMADQQTSMGSTAELEIHTEQAFSTLRPDWLSLACLRGDPVARTYTLPVGAIIDSLTDDELALACGAHWTCGVDLSFKLHGQEFFNGDIRGPMPIVCGLADDPQLVFDQDLMRGDSVRANELLKTVVGVYYKERYTHVFAPGDIMIVDNRRAVHGRSGYTPRYDGLDRFLIRCFAVRDLGASSYARMGIGGLNGLDGRMIQARFS